MSEYNGTYQGRVINTADPLGLKRIVLQVPNIMGINLTPWATPGYSKLYSLPKVGATVYVTFHGGDINQPIWWGGAELDVSGQVTNAISSAVTTSNSYTDTAALNATTTAETYANQRTFRGRTYKTSSQTVSSLNTWVDIAWQSNEAYDYGLGDVITFSNSANLQVPLNGEYVFNIILGLSIPDTTTICGLRALWDQGGSTYWIIGATGPIHFGPDLWDPQINFTFMTDQASPGNIRIQLRTNKTMTINQDNVYYASPIATRSRVDIACVKRYT